MWATMMSGTGSGEQRKWACSWINGVGCGEQVQGVGRGNARRPPFEGHTFGLFQVAAKGAINEPDRGKVLAPLASPRVFNSQ